MAESYMLGPKAAKGLVKLLREANGHHDMAGGSRRAMPDVPAWMPPQNYWQVKYDDADGWLVRVAESATSITGIHVHDEPVAGETEWYKIANAPGGTTVGAFAVYAHVKRRVKVGGGGIGECVFVSAGAVGSTVPGSEPANYSAGDVYTVHVATCTTTAVTGSGSTTYARSVRRVHRDKVMLESRAPGVLEPYWSVPTVSSSGWTTYTPHTPASAAAPICGGNLADVALPASGSANAWYLIDCTGASPVPSVVTAQSAAAGKIYVNVLALSDGCLTGDTRANLANAVFYP